MVNRQPIIRPDLIRWVSLFKDPAKRQIRASKKMRRAFLGLLRPIRCPACRQYTRQAPSQVVPGKRKCLACGLIFNRPDSRKVA